MYRMMRIADYIMKRIQEEGVCHVFYVPGGQCVYLTDALRRNEELEAVSMHHEQAAAMAALSYSQYNGQFGACLVTTGCAGTNTMTGLLHAWQDSIPCIFVSGQQNEEQTIAYSGLPLRQVGVQEADIVTLVKPITKYAVMLTDANQVAYELDKAIYEAKHGRKGPVWIDVPLNIQNSMVDEEQLVRYEREEETELIELESIQNIAMQLQEAKRPLLLVGQGVRSAKGIDEFRTFVERINIPVVFTRAASDYMGYTHPLNVGIAVSTCGERAANFAIQNADLVISVGCRLSTDTTGADAADFARNAKLIVVDIDDVEHQKKGALIDTYIHCDAKTFFEKMNEIACKSTDKEWIAKCQHWKKRFRPYIKEEIDNNDMLNICYFMERFSEIMPPKAAVLCDAGNTGVAVPAYCHMREGDRFVHSIAQGEMGYAFPGSFGVACAHDGAVISFSGDGSFMMNLQELQTLSRNQWNIKVIIINNNGYSGVRHGQKAHFRGKSIGTDPSNGITFPDYHKVADAFDIAYMKIKGKDDLEEKLSHIFDSDKPLICEVMCDPDQFLLHSGLVKYGKRKFGFRPIEDQSPFLDRDVFFEEMITEPHETSYGEPV